MLLNRLKSSGLRVIKGFLGHLRWILGLPRSVNCLPVSGTINCHIALPRGLVIHHLEQLVVRFDGLGCSGALRELLRVSILLLGSLGGQRAQISLALLLGKSYIVFLIISGFLSDDLRLFLDFNIHLKGSLVIAFVPIFFHSHFLTPALLLANWIFGMRVQLFRHN
jgi:hypothetical protein